MLLHRAQGASNPRHFGIGCVSTRLLSSALGASGGTRRFVPTPSQGFDSPLKKLDRFFQDGDLTVGQHVFGFRGLREERESCGLPFKQHLSTGHSVSSWV